MAIALPPPQNNAVVKMIDSEKAGIIYLTQDSGTLPITGASRAQYPLMATINDVIKAYPSPREKFEALSNDWLKGQAGKSRVNYNHSSHRQIVDMGTAAIPFILSELRQESGHWFVALKSIVGYSPVPIESRGDFELAKRAWLDWGNEQRTTTLDHGSRTVDAAVLSETGVRPV
jgi:hypothetical protein